VFWPHGRKEASMACEDALPWPVRHNYCRITESWSGTPSIANPSKDGLTIKVSNLLSLVSYALLLLEYFTSFSLYFLVARI